MQKSNGIISGYSYIQQLREGVHNFFVTFIEVLRDRPPGHDWELEPGVTCGDYLFGMLQVDIQLFKIQNYDIFFYECNDRGKKYFAGNPFCSLF